MDIFKPVEYYVEKITGDYAILKTKEGIENTVALALLPAEIDEGKKVLWENMTYTMV